VRRGCASESQGHDPAFNPRTRTGCDQMRLPLTVICASFQSTHPHGVRRHLA